MYYIYTNGSHLGRLVGLSNIIFMMIHTMFGLSCLGVFRKDKTPCNDNGSCVAAANGRKNVYMSQVF